MQFLRKVDSLLHEVCIVVTVEHKAVGVVIIQEQYQLETVGVLGEVRFNLLLKRCVALNASACTDFLQYDVAIGKVEHTVECLCIVGL